MSIVLLLRFLQPERLLRVESMPEVTDFFATLQSPITPLLPSFWAGEALFAGLQGGRDLLHIAALWTTAAAAVVVVGWAFERWHFAGFSKAQEARKARFTQWRDARSRWPALLPLSPVRRHLLVKDLKVFLRDVSQWSQLLLLLALVLVYLYNFRVLDLERIPYMSGFLKNVYAFLNLAMAGFVMSTVTVRFVFPAVSAEGAAFWIIRTAPISLQRLPVVEVLDRAGAGAGADGDPDRGRQRAARRRSVPEADVGGRGRLHGVRAGRPGLRPRRALSAVRRRQPEPGRRLVRRRRVHDPRRAVHPGDDRAARLAVEHLPVRAVPQPRR